MNVADVSALAAVVAIPVLNNFFTLIFGCTRVGETWGSHFESLFALIGPMPATFAYWNQQGEFKPTNVNAAACTDVLSKMLDAKKCARGFLSRRENLRCNCGAKLGFEPGKFWI